MNIFVTSIIPEVAASHLDDKRINKMIIESAQIICVALNNISISVPYKLTHINHPVVKWTCSSVNNLNWLIIYFNSLHSEWLKRGFKKHLTCEKMSLPIIDFYDRFCIMFKKFHEPTEFQNCAANVSLNLNFKYMNTVDAYKKYLNIRWKMDKIKPKWTNTFPPYFKEE